MTRSRVAVLLAVVVGLAAIASLSQAAPPSAVSNLNVTPTPNLASHLAQYTITFKTSASGALSPGDTITLKFQSGTVPGSFCGDLASFASNVTVNGAVTSVSSIVFCLEVRVNVPVAIGNNTNVTVVVGSTTNVVQNPGAGSYALKVHTTKDFRDANSKKYTIVAQKAPVASSQSVSTAEDVPSVITLSGSDADGDSLTFAIVSGGGPAHGALGPVGAPTCTGLVPNTCSAPVTYTPTGNYSGPDTFQFRVRDGIVNSAAATVSITVNPVNDAPVALDDDATVEQDSGANTINVLANDSDVEGNTLTITSAAPMATNGTVSCSASDCTYTPNGGFDGNDSFDYAIADGNGGTDSATVNVEVTPAGPGPGGGTFTAEICAKTGSVTMPDGASIDIWGFALGDCDVASPATLPGPILDVEAGDEVHITLDNSLDEYVSLEFVGQDLIPDPTGAGPGTEKEYVFTASEPGTYLYESGMNRQALMGLYGALIVRPATANQAYDGSASGYDVEAVLVLSEIDPNFNADPNNFNLVDYAPKYWLINGEAYPDTDFISADAGDRVLLRYLNAGSLHHTMALLGTHQRVIAKDAYPATYPYDVVPETIPAGSTLDTIATIPAEGTYWVYNRQLHLDNAGVFPGGMLTFIEAGP